MFNDSHNPHLRTMSEREYNSYIITTMNENRKARVLDFWKNKKDRTLDSKPFMEPIETLYIGKRDILHKYKASDLDSDFNWTHEK